MFPTIFFGGAPVDTYAFCALLSFVVVLIAALILRPKEFPVKYILAAMVFVFFFAYVGASLCNIVIHASEYKGEDIGTIFKNSGMAYLGGVIFGFFAIWVFCRIIKVSFLVVADNAAPFFMLERVIGRLGCLGYGCCYGIPSNLPWAYPFRTWGINNIVPRHPTQAYEIIIALAIFVSSRYLYKKIKEMPGVFGRTHKEAPSAGITFFYAYLCYSVLRFTNESLRAEGPFLYGPIKMSHVALAVFAIVSAIGLFILIKKSPAKQQIVKVLKNATVRLVLWLIGGGIVILTALSLRGIF